MPTLYLCSGSPRRAQLLRQIGVAFRRLPVDIDESVGRDETPEAYVARLSQEKSRAGVHLIEPEPSSSSVFLGSDTSVVVDGQILGKPTDYDNFCTTMNQLSGRSHSVITAVTTCWGDACQTAISVSQVAFSVLSETQIRAYWDTGEPADKAGGYGIQGLAAAFIQSLNGSYSGVMGLPLFETTQLLQDCGIPVWQSQSALPVGT